MPRKTVDIQQVPDIELQDISMVDQIRIKRSYACKGEVVEEEAQIPLPEEIVSMLDELTGDGKGRVTVGAELASNIEFGMKAGAFVSIGVSCDSSEAALESTHNILYSLAEKLVIEDHAHMSAIRDSMVDRGKQLGEKCPGVNAESRTSRPKKSSLEDSKPKTSFRSR